MITLIRGAQRYFSFTAGTNGYAQCSQIVLKLVRDTSAVKAKEWRKVAPITGTMAHYVGVTQSREIIISNVIIKLK